MATRVMTLLIAWLLVRHWGAVADRVIRRSGTPPVPPAPRASW